MELGMCHQEPLCQGLSWGDRAALRGDADRALPADGAPSSAVGLGRALG